MVLRIKVTGIEDEEALKFLKTSLKCRIHEEELLLVDKNRVSKGVVMEKSKDQPPGKGEGKEDIIKIVMRSSAKFFCDFEEFREYPFDILEFKYRFELSHFELKDKATKKTRATYRFDFYPSVMEAYVPGGAASPEYDLSWRSDVNALPEFELAWRSVQYKILAEKKPWWAPDDKEKKN